MKDYGAVGDGVTDDLPAIHRAFAAVAGQGQRLLFPAGTYMVSGTVMVPNKTQIYGSGRGDANGANTVIKALPRFQSGGTLLQMGPAPGPDFGIQVENLTLDRSSVAGVCLSNQFAEEQSYGKNLLLTNCGSIGLSISTTGVQNSGPFENLEIYPGSGSTVNASSMCIQVTGSISFRGITGVTCNAGTTYSVRPSVAIALDGDGQFSDIHIEHFTTGILLGNNGASADGITVMNVEFGPDVVTGVQIATPPNGLNNQNLAIFGLKCVGCTNLLSDAELGINDNSSTVGWYMIGNGGGASRSMSSSNFGVGSKVAGPFFAFGNSSFGPGNNNQQATFTLWNATSTGVTSGIEWVGAGQGGNNLFEWRNINDQVMTSIGSDGHVQAPALNVGSGAAGMSASGLTLANAAPLSWSSTGAWNGSADTGLARAGAGMLQVTNGSTGSGSIAAQSVQLGGKRDTAYLCRGAPRDVLVHSESKRNCRSPAGV